MIYTKFKDKEISLMGFGAMRLPVQEDNAIDEQQVKEMVKYAMDNGVNYYDTAWPYHAGESELVLGRVLKEYPRDSFYLANKYPGHQIADVYDPKYIFELQLQKCQVEYFDFYLYHNVYEKSLETYVNPKWNIIEYFKEQKALGKIKHLGLSTHAQAENLEEILDAFGDCIEFCQIQLNYLDMSLQKAAEKLEILAKRNIPVIVMEPLRGGKLVNIGEDDANRLKAMSSEEPVEWALRFFQNIPNLVTVLNGVSSMEQLVQNVEVFREAKPLADDELKVLLEVAENMKGSIPCTACRYCTDGCPVGLNIPLLLGVYNDISYQATTTAILTVEGLPDDKKMTACINCGKCSRVCPQNIDIPKALAEFAVAYDKIPKWADISAARAKVQPVTK